MSKRDFPDSSQPQVVVSRKDEPTDILERTGPTFWENKNKFHHQYGTIHAKLDVNAPTTATGVRYLKDCGLTGGGGGGGGGICSAEQYAEDIEEQSDKVGNYRTMILTGM